MFSRVINFFSQKPAKPNSIVATPSIERLFVKSIASVLGSVDSNPDEVLKKQGISAYDDMEAKDAHVYSVYNTRKLAISLIPWEILPADDSPNSIDMADFVFQAIDDIHGPFCEKIKQLLDAIGKGFSILEIVWKLKDSGRWAGKYTIEDLIFHKQKYWFFKDRRWHKSEDSTAIFDIGSNLTGTPVPWSKIIHYAFDEADSLYGRAAFKPIYWYSWFKKEGWKSWIIFLNKFGSPTVLGRFPDGAPKAQQDLLLSVIETIQEETGIIIPESMAISLLEASRSGPVSFRELSDACNAEISKAILGATQTVEEGRRGSYALSRAHSEVRHERVEADAIVIADIIQQQLVKRLIDFNFITDLYPQFVMRFRGKSAIGKQIKEDEE